VAKVSPDVFDPARLAAVRATRLLDTGPEEPFDRLARLAASVLETPFAFVTIVDDRRSFWKSCIGVSSTDLADRENLVEESFCQYVVGSRRPLIVTDAANDPRTRNNPSVESMGVRAWAGFPLQTERGEVLGTFCVVDTEPRQWSEHDLSVLETLAHAAAGEIALRVTAEQATVFARTLQESLLPPDLPVVPGLETAARYLPAGETVGVLGDFYDMFQAARHRWHLVIGDVCGHGVEAAKTTALARWAIRAAATQSSRPGRVLSMLNEVLIRHDGDAATFLTAQFVTVRVTGERVEIVLGGAGHPPALIRRADGAVERTGLGGQPIGMIENPDIATSRHLLHPGDALVLYTDGLVEARRDGEMLSVERVAEVLAGTAGSDAEETTDVLVRLARDFTGAPLADDLAIIVLQALPRS
jgi:sigma-B regulation protein RsbU (phosphoserine phosphatase)